MISFLCCPTILDNVIGTSADIPRCTSINPYVVCIALNGKNALQKLVHGPPPEHGCGSYHSASLLYWSKTFCALFIVGGGFAISQHPHVADRFRLVQPRQRIPISVHGDQGTTTEQKALSFFLTGTTSFP